MEKKIDFTSDGFILEGLFEKSSGSKAVIITHPHPLMGGDMDNPVVDKIRRSYFKKGYSTLKFNFRGTGESQGEFDNGNGEQNDVRSAIEFLNRNGYTDIDLAGYSFGAWVGLMTTAGTHGFSRLILVSPPVDFIDFGPPSITPSLYLAISGSHDTYASPGHVKKVIAQWNPAVLFKEIPGADHFYSGMLGELERILEEHL